MTNPYPQHRRRAHTMTAATTISAGATGRDDQGWHARRATEDGGTS